MFQGSDIQNAIYVSGESPWPIAPEEWEARAAEVLEPGPFDYIAGGAGSEATMPSACRPSSSQSTRGL